MAKLLTRLLPLLLMGLLATPLLSFNICDVCGIWAEYSTQLLLVDCHKFCSPFALADDSVVGEEDDDLSVEDEEEDSEEPVTIREGEEEEDDTTREEPKSDDGEEEEEEEEDEFFIGPSTDAKTVMIFTNRDKDNIIAGEVVDTLIGFTNIGKEKNFIVTGIEASLRYPQDFTYHIQNFSMLYFDRYIEPNVESSFAYSFTPSDTLFARPFGLVLNLYYKDEENNEFRDSVFNNTINIVEYEEGFDTETFFMYVFMVSGLCLLMFVVHYVYTTTVRRGGRSAAKKQQPVIEMGTQKKRNAVDLNWIPESHIAKNSPRKSPRNQSSPRNRKPNKPLKTPNVD